MHDGRTVTVATVTSRRRPSPSARFALAHYGKHQEDEVCAHTRYRRRRIHRLAPRSRLVARGDDVVVLDSLEEQVTTAPAPDLPPGVELIVGNVGDAALADTALAGADRVVHLAAAVGVGQSMYEIARYTELNTMATARFLERVVAQRPMPTRLVVASSMSIYGEGEYVCEEHGRVAPGPRPEEQLLARAWETACPSCGRELAPVGTSEAKPLIPTSIYAINKRDHEEMCLVTGAAYGIPRSRCASSTSTALARRCPTRTPASRRSSPRACSTAARR